MLIVAFNPYPGYYSNKETSKLITMTGLIFKGLILSVLSMMFAETIWARERGEKVIGKAILEVIYERKKVTDTLDIANDFRIDKFNLRISDSCSGFYSEQLRHEDSLDHHSGDHSMLFFRDKNYQKFRLSLPNDYVYKNYPEGKLTVHDRFDGCHWEYSEDWEKPRWEITDSTMNILGYECLMGQAFWRGRRWIAWFAPEIPIQEGPWKLCGLPGLILRAHDSKGHYSYEAKSINTENIGNVVYFCYYDVFFTKPRRFLIDKWNSIQESLGYKILSNAEAFGLKRRPNLKKPGKLPHRNYDPEETDFPHEKK